MKIIFVIFIYGLVLLPVNVFAETVSLPPLVEEKFESFWATTFLDNHYKVRIHNILKKQFESTAGYLEKENTHLLENFKIGRFENTKSFVNEKLTTQAGLPEAMFLHLGNISLVELKIDDALDFYVRAASNKETVELLEIIGEVFFISGNFSESAAYFEKCVKIYSTNGRRFSLEVASFLERASISHLLKKDLSMALQNSIEAFEIYGLLRGDADIITANSAIMTGRLYYLLDEQESALEYFKKAKSILLKVESGDVQLEVGRVLNLMGLAYSSIGLDESSLADFRKVVSIRKRKLGVDDPLLADAYSNVADLMVKIGFVNESIAYYNLAYDIYTSADSIDSMDLAHLLGKIGGAYYLKSDYKVSFGYLNRSLEIYKGLLGENHPEVAAVYNNKGNLFFAMGNYIEAEKQFEAAMHIFTDRYGDSHLSVADSMTNIGLALKEQKKFEEAHAFLIKGLQLRRDNLGDLHPDVANSLDVLGEIEEAMGNNVAALKHFLESVEIKKKVFGPDSLELVETIARTGYHLLGVDPYEATPFFLEARNILIKSGREANPLVYEIQSYLLIIQQLKALNR